MPSTIRTTVQLDLHPVTLNAGELRVLDALLALDQAWEIYVQPIIGWSQPDFIAAHPRYGLCVIEVRDWEVGSMRQAPNGALEIHGPSGWVTTDESPREDAAQARNAVLTKFFDDADLDEPEVVRGVVVLPRYSTADACSLLRRAPTTDARTWPKIWGGTAITNDPLCVVAGHPRPVHRAESPVALARVRRHCADVGTVFTSRCD